MSKEEINEKITQSVLYGSVYLSLKTDFYTERDLLHWLNGKSFDIDNVTTYLILCIFTEQNQQYLDSGEHFLVNNKEYACIAYNIFPDVIDLPENNIEDIGESLIAYVYQNLTLKNIDDTIVGLITRKFYGDFFQNNMKYFYRLRMSKSFGDTSLITLIETDWVEKINKVKNANLYELILNRITYLKCVAPSYCDNVAIKCYRSLIKKLHKKYDNVYKLNKEKIKLLDSIFPGIICKDFFEYEGICGIISTFPHEMKAYVLGFEIDMCMPNNEQLKDSFEKLNLWGYDKYMDFIKQYNKNPFAISPFENFAIPSNSTNVLMDDVDDHFPFDIIRFQVGKHLYKFTRVEFKQILDSGRNPWTNENLPSYFIDKIKQKLNMSENLKFPKPSTMTEYFTDLSETI